jgi:hypothetical protein
MPRRPRPWRSTPRDTRDRVIARRRARGPHRREPDRDRRGDVPVGELAQPLEQRQVGIDGGFAQPVAAVRPAAVIQDIGQVAVQREDRVHCVPGQAAIDRAVSARR